MLSPAAAFARFYNVGLLLVTAACYGVSSCEVLGMFH